VGREVSRVAACGLFVFRLLIAGAIAAILSSAADARQRHRDAIAKRMSAAPEDYTPPAASIVIDGGNGTVLQASSPDLRCHPASLTKVMTLYLLFERLEAGELHLGDFLTASEHASEQAPSKLDLKPGQTITVENAIKGIVTKSANDAAVVVAESLGRSEENFAKLMTQRAHALGMANTTYVNASGLPDDGQVTTAKDQALLGRAIYERFPRYYKYFSTEAFVYGGEVMRNHNHLLGAVEGVDGIKTGYTRTSGFNLITSVHRDGRHIIAVILGGKTASERDAHMRKLITTYTKPAIFQGVALVQHPSLADDGRRNNSSDPTQAFIVKAVAPEAQQQVPMSPLTLGATPIRSPNFSKPGGEVSARWPSPSEMFEPLASIPGMRSGTNDDARNSERRKPDPRD
jgi:D-alanyl-D-alanine carboxypeptidase